jgi:ATP-dependent Lhr-like helicase
MSDPASQSDLVDEDRRLRASLGDVGAAFFAAFPYLTVVQRSAIPSIRDGSSTLVCAATAAGKTEALLAPLIWCARKAPQRKGIKVLAVAPTRALVADLRARLESPLRLLNWTVGAQTSDFQDAAREPDVLVTTPESFDSMMVRRATWQEGKPVRHLLAGVRAVFVDEAHLFDCTPRGEQVIFLLARLRRLRAQAAERGWSQDSTLQVCAASATVPEPAGLAERLLGPDAKLVFCAGSRELHLFTESGEWRVLRAGENVCALRDSLPLVQSNHEVAARLWQCLQDGECRKALVFVNARAHCDVLARVLRTQLHRHRELWVGGHHGSLSRNERLDAERHFQQEKDAVLVATSTLEVGVDIGDVDLVVLVSPPPDVSAFLQRIGRGGRRTSQTRILALPRSILESAAFASQLAAASQGQLESRPRFRRWDVLPQQVLSYIRQNRDQGRTASAIADLTNQVWPGNDTKQLAQEALAFWQSEGLLADIRGKLHFAGDWHDYAVGGDADDGVHSNIGGSGGGALVYDAVTHEPIAEVGNIEGSRMLIAGQAYEVVSQLDVTTVRRLSDAEANTVGMTPNYGGRRRPVFRHFAEHVRTGCGFSGSATPLLESGARMAWFHFGGELMESFLLEYFGSAVFSPGLRGIALMSHLEITTETLAAIPAEAVKNWQQNNRLRILGAMNPGKWMRSLQACMHCKMLEESKVGQEWTNWLVSRNVFTVVLENERSILTTLIGSGI